MNSGQIQQLIIQKSNDLPAEILQEVLDFIDFLKLRKSGAAKQPIHTSLSEINHSEINHLEEEFADYKTVYPQE